MRDLNIDFMDLYKRVDNFIKDAYSSSTGMTKYIEEMEQKSFKGKSVISGWDTTYTALKHLRWIRNQLAHEVDYDSEICTESDYDQLYIFYDNLYNAEDPLSLLYTYEKRKSETHYIRKKSKLNAAVSNSEKAKTETHFIRKIPKLNVENTNYKQSVDSQKISTEMYNEIKYQKATVLPDDKRTNASEEKSPSILKRIVNFLLGK